METGIVNTSAEISDALRVIGAFAVYAYANLRKRCAAVGGVVIMERPSVDGILESAHGSVLWFRVSSHLLPLLSTFDTSIGSRSS